VAGGFDFGAFLEELTSSPQYAGQIVHQEVLLAREAVYGELSAPLPEALREALGKLGIEHLYSHQASAIEHIRAGEHTVIVTSTASGKTLCYHLPVLETLLAEPGARCLAMFPTKALAQDQLRALRRLADVHPDLATLCRAGTYDGDTPTSTRRKLRGEANAILTNPEMLHQGILPYHSRWAGFFSDLRYVIIDEVHTYRGIFGSNVANVLRRLQRICAHYGSSPTFVCCSATIANPKELAEQLTGLPVALVDNDGAPKGPKRFLLWNPPHLDEARMERRSSNLEAQELLVSLLRRGVQTIAFARTRVVTELLYRYASQSLAQHSPSLAEAVRAYRAGYLPEERREIERRLFSGELMGVTSTNALELGIDVGSLDAAVIVSYPGTIASTWQQAGRAGRGAAEALVVLVAYNDPLDQYLMQRPEFVFGRSPEHAVIDPHNPYLLANHLQCAAYELPLREDELAAFGPESEPILGILQELRKVQQLDRAWYWSSTEYPAAQVNLRAISDATFTIMDTADGNRVIGTVDAVSAPEAVYPGGVYLHEADTYLVRRLDLEGRAAYVERADVDYYTQAVLSSSIVPGEVQAARETAEGRLHFGEATVSWQTTAFTRVRFYTQENVGYTKLDLPAQHLETASCWFLPSAEALGLPGRYGLRAVEGLSGIRNVAVNMLPLVAMCDRTDVGGLVNSSNFGTPTMFLYDRYPGGLGFSEKGYQLFETLLAHCLDTIAACPCEDGCPSCVGLPVTQPAQQADLDLGHGYAVPDKEAALVLLHFLLGREPYRPRRSGRPRRRPRTAPAPPVDAPREASVAAQVSKRLTGRRGRIGL
jgi:DEAD/DEAH box helicase domain-containing protein